MRSLIHCRNRLHSVLWVLLSLWGATAHAIVLNFSARLLPGTCTFNLSQSALSLGTLNPGNFSRATLLAAKPFTLSVTNCRGTNASLMPVVVVTGEGITQDGRWLFRDANSAKGVGVMLMKTSVRPGYNDAEVKNGDTLPLAAVGVTPLDQSIAFYAGATCGSGAACDAVMSGSLTARVLFSLDYR